MLLRKTLKTQGGIIKHITSEEHRKINRSEKVNFLDRFFLFFMQKKKKNLFSTNA